MGNFKIPIQKIKNLQGIYYDSFFIYAAQQEIIKNITDNKLEGIVFEGNSPKYFENALGGDFLKLRLAKKLYIKPPYIAQQTL